MDEHCFFQIVCIGLGCTEFDHQRNSVDVDESLPVKSLVKDCLRNLKVEEIDDRVDSREYMFARSKKYQKDASLDVKLGFLESTAGTNRV